MVAWQDGINGDRDNWLLSVHILHVNPTNNDRWDVVNEK